MNLTVCPCQSCVQNLPFKMVVLSSAVFSPFSSFTIILTPNCYPQAREAVSLPFLKDKNLLQLNYRHVLKLQFNFRQVVQTQLEKRKSCLRRGWTSFKLCPLTSAFETRPAGTTVFAFILAAQMIFFSFLILKWPQHQCNLELWALTAWEQQRFLYVIAANNYHWSVSMHPIKPQPLKSGDKSDSLICRDDLWLVFLITLGNNTAAVESAHLTQASFEQHISCGI